MNLRNPDKKRSRNTVLGVVDFSRKGKERE